MGKGNSNTERYQRQLRIKKKIRRTTEITGLMNRRTQRAQRVHDGRWKRKELVEGQGFVVLKETQSSICSLPERKKKKKQTRECGRIREVLEVAKMKCACWSRWQETKATSLSLSPFPSPSSSDVVFYFCVFSYYFSPAYIGSQLRPQSPLY